MNSNSDSLIYILERITESLSSKLKALSNSLTSNQMPKTMSCLTTRKKAAEVAKLQIRSKVLAMSTSCLRWSLMLIQSKYSDTFVLKMLVLSHCGQAKRTSLIPMTFLSANFVEQDAP
jgi:hypothetical protein